MTSIQNGYCVGRKQTVACIFAVSNNKYTPHKVYSWVVNSNSSQHNISRGSAVANITVDAWKALSLLEHLRIPHHLQQNMIIQKIE